jgi:molecular chaperone HscB
VSSLTGANDPFRVLGVNPTFDLDVADLERRQRELSKALHPDRHASSLPAERRAALGEAIRVNEAFRALRDPLTRAEALLGVLTGSPEPPATTSALPPGFLLEVMDLREQLAELRARQELPGLERLRGQIVSYEQALHAELSSSFAAAQAANAAVTPGTHTALAKLRYYRRMLDEVRASLDDLA